MRFTEEHEWLRAEDDGLVTMGITEHAANELGDVVFIEVPETGTTVEPDDEIVVIESVKAASEIRAPMAGEIVAINDALPDNPALINEDPLGGAWVLRIRPADPTAMDGFMDADAYAAFVG